VRIVIAIYIHGHAGVIVPADDQHHPRAHPHPHPATYNRQPTSGVGLGTWSLKGVVYYCDSIQYIKLTNDACRRQQP